MNEQKEINNSLEEIRGSSDISFRTRKLNSIYDILESFEPDINYLEDLTRNLIEMIIIENDKKIRGHLFDVLEKAYKKNLSIKLPLEKLIADFDNNDPALIANTLLLLPLSGDKKYIDLAKKYKDHQNEFIRKNAEYVLENLKA